MKEIFSVLFGSLAIIFWIAGIVIAKGFWSTLFAVTIPFYAWYLIVEKLMIFYGVA